MPLPFIIAAIAAVALAVIVLKFLGWTTILDWFKGRSKISDKEKGIIGATIRELKAKGKCSVVQVRYDEKNDVVLEGVRYKAEEICDELEDREELVIYN